MYEKLLISKLKHINGGGLYFTIPVTLQVDEFFPTNGVAARKNSLTRTAKIKHRKFKKVLVVWLKFSLKNTSMPWLLMSWLLASLGHQQPRYWLFGTVSLRSMTSMPAHNFANPRPYLPHAISEVEDGIIGTFSSWSYHSSIQWRHNEHDHDRQLHDCLLNRLFRHRSKKTSKLRVTGLCAGNSQVAGEFPAQTASYA